MTQPDKDKNNFSQTEQTVDGLREKLVWILVATVVTGTVIDAAHTLADLPPETYTYLLAMAICAYIAVVSGENS